MPQNSRSDLIQVLVSQNLVDVEKVNKAKAESDQTKTPLDLILLRDGVITKNDLIKAKSILYGVPFIDIAEVPVSAEINSTLSEDEALQSKALIFSKENGVVKVAMANPLDIQTIRYLEQKLNSPVQIYITSEEDLLNKIKNTYSNTFSSEVSSVVEQAVSSSDYVDISSEQQDDLSSINITNAPVAKIVNLILESSVRDRASDIHIEPQKDRVRVRFRINGILKEKLTLPLQVGPSLVSRIKILAKMQIDEKRKPLDGGFQIKSKDGQEIDLRISTLPTVLGEKVVIRLLRKDLGILSLEDTGMRGSALKTFTEGLKTTAGIILVTGPTGSGKTVTVATSIHLLNKPELNIVTVEDPVEIKIPGVNQVQVNVEAGLTFANALRSFLRQDPNIIIVGEIRDQETAQLAAQASLTGHLVVSTLHTNSAAGVLPRLLDMGIEPYIIASTVHICSAQRLCRKVCDECKEAYEVGEAEVLEIKRILGQIRDFDISKFAQYQAANILPGLTIAPSQISTPTNGPKLYLFKGKGCDRCGGTGYSGRIGIFEVFKVTEKIGSLVMQHATSEEIEKVAMEDGMIKMIQDGYFKCLDGITTLEEVQRVIHL